MMRPLTLASFESHLGMLLRDLPRATTADLTDFAIAYWDGYQLIYCYLRENDQGDIEEEFDLADESWEEWQEALTAWCAHPAFSERAQVLDWLKDAPPHEATA